MHRFFVEPEQSRERELELSEREFHHAGVLRLKEGERVAALDGAGSEMLCTIAKLSKRSIVLRVDQRSFIPRLPCEITLVQAIPKGKAMDLIAQKAAELGVSRIVPLLAERTVSQLDEENAESRVQKWTYIAIDAIKQCGSAWLPRISPPVTPARYLAGGEGSELNLIATLQPDAKHPRVFLREFAEANSTRPRSVSVWVGPEGDFTPAEINSVRASGALPITLGPLVLRSETAAIYCVSVLNYELQV